MNINLIIIANLFVGKAGRSNAYCRIIKFKHYTLAIMKYLPQFSPLLGVSLYVSTPLTV